MKYKMIYVVGAKNEYTLAESEVFTGPFSDKQAKPELLYMQAFESNASLLADEKTVMNEILKKEVEGLDERYINYNRLQKGNVIGDNYYLVDFNTTSIFGEDVRKIAVLSGKGKEIHAIKVIDF